jgi:hypothetical protein
MGVELLNQSVLRGNLVLLITGWRESDTGDVTFWVTTALLGAEAGRLLLRAPGITAALPVPSSPCFSLTVLAWASRWCRCWTLPTLRTSSECSPSLSSLIKASCDESGGRP